LLEYIEYIDIFANQFFYNGTLVKLSLVNKDNIVFRRINFKYEKIKNEFMTYKKLKATTITTLINSILLFAYQKEKGNKEDDQNNNS
jgi:hypothetical protein